MSALSEAGKLPAFVRRDIRIMLSYRMAAAGSLIGLAAYALVLSWLGKLVDVSRLPTIDGTHVTYMAFVTIGIAINMVTITLLQQVSTAIRQEQMLGTLESLLCTPTKIWTLQVGSAALALVSIPVRLGVFIAILGVVFGLHFHVDGIVPSIVVVLAFIPFLWGTGLLLGGAILTFRRGGGAVALLASLLAASSGSFFPVSVLPHWLQPLARINPVTLAVSGLRDALIGGSGWRSIGTHVLELAPLSIAAMIVGVVAFRLALQRERRNGTLGLY
jgi:ABC-2 type transport system permease protein